MSEDDDGASVFPMPISKRQIVSKGFASMQASRFNDFQDINACVAAAATKAAAKASLGNITNVVAKQIPAAVATKRQENDDDDANAGGDELKVPAETSKADKKEDKPSEDQPPKVYSQRVK